MTHSPEGSGTFHDAEIIQDLAWRLIDQCLDEEGGEQLALLLEHSDAARKLYAETVQLHVALLEHYGALPDVEQLLKMVMEKMAAEPKPKAAAAGNTATNARLDLPVPAEIDMPSPNGV